jgi:antitoxin FitA
MAQVVVRNLDESVKNRLKRRAARRGRSMEAEIRDILNKGTLITRHFAGKGIGIDFDIPEWRGKEARPARFRK